jgi:hypothetical protein
MPASAALLAIQPAISGRVNGLRGNGKPNRITPVGQTQGVYGVARRGGPAEQFSVQAFSSLVSRHAASTVGRVAQLILDRLRRSSCSARDRR